MRRLSGDPLMSGKKGGRRAVPLLPLLLALLSGTTFLVVLLAPDFGPGKGVQTGPGRGGDVQPEVVEPGSLLRGPVDLQGHPIPLQVSDEGEVELPIEQQVPSEELLDVSSLSRQLVDQITLGKAYLVVAKESGNFQLAWEFSNQVRACQDVLARAVRMKRSVSRKELETAMQAMLPLIAQAKEFHYDAATMIMRLKSQVQVVEERVQSISVQSTFFGQLAAEAVPKSLHCFGMRLTMEWASDSARFQELLTSAGQPSERLSDNALRHFCIFSDNPLAVSVVVNSTAQNAKEPEQCVFHIVTDQMNFAAMKTWFALNPPTPATIEIQNVNDLTWLNASYSPVLKQLQDADIQSYYFKASMQDSKNTIKFRNPKYLSMLNHLRFYLPEVYPDLERILFLDDDVVVQKDLAPLFDLDLRGNVNGAVETCKDSFHRYHKYLNFSDPRLSDNFDPEACGWAYGMNTFDLREWKKQNITEVYHFWQVQNADRTLWKLGTLPPGLLTFYNSTLALDRSWHVLGLGYDPDVDSKLISNAAVIHYNGNMKPWLKLAMSRYKALWSKYINYAEPFIAQCNIH